jgi:hypothetical protein
MAERSSNLGERAYVKRIEFDIGRRNEGRRKTIAGRTNLLLLSWYSARAKVDVDGAPRKGEVRLVKLRLNYNTEVLCVKMLISSAPAL